MSAHLKEMYTYVSSDPIVLVRKVMYQARTMQGCNAMKVNCSYVYSTYVLKPVLFGRNL